MLLLALIIVTIIEDDCNYQTNLSTTVETINYVLMVPTRSFSWYLNSVTQHRKGFSIMASKILKNFFATLPAKCQHLAFADLSGLLCVACMFNGQLCTNMYAGAAAGMVILHMHQLRTRV